MTNLRLQKLEKGTGWGLLLLVAIMPFHAFLSVWIGSLVGHQAIIQAWKELLAVILLVATAYLVYREPDRLKRGGKLLPIIALSFAAITLIVTILHPQSLSGIIYGIKTDFEYIVLFFVALWGTSRKLYLQLPKIILITSSIVAGFAILHATILPHDILMHFGYGPNTIEPYQFVGTLSDTIRTPSFLGGPNQLGSFLILPLCLAVAMFIKRPRWSLVLASILFTGALWYTYSRSAWIGAIIAVFVTIAATIKTKKQALYLALASASLIVIAVVSMSVLSHSKGPYQYFILHSGSGIETNNSTTQHADAYSNGLKAITQNPTGSGLGSAGPASFHNTNKLIPENYYLQIAIETSLLGLLAFIAIVIVLWLKLWAIRSQNIMVPALIGALVGLSVVNLFLHGWADSSTAFIFWIAAGLTLAGAKKHV